MKEKRLLFLFIFNILIEIAFLDQILITKDPEVDFDKDEKEQKQNDTDDDDQPLVITQEYRDKKGNHLKITRVHYQKSKNLNSNSEGATPIQIMRIFDDRIDSIFEDIIRQSIGIKMLLNGLSNIDNDDDEEDDENEVNINRNSNNEEKSLFEELFEDEENENEQKGKKENNNITLENEKKDLNKKNIKKIGKLNANMNNINKIKKKKKKLSRKEIIFSRVCKYIFYSIILFTIYILVKKILEVLEIIEPDNMVEIKIENDETSQLKKSSENKQN